MDLRRHLLLLASLLLVPAPLAHAQAAPDPSGHWTGALQAPEMEVSFEIDFAKNTKGELAGTVTIPAQMVKGLPLRTVTQQGQSISFASRTDQGFTGKISPDGKSITGDFNVNGISLPFTLAKTGPAKIDPPIKSAPISKELVGTWNAKLESKESAVVLRFVLTLANLADGSGQGHLLDVDEGGLVVPLTVTQKASNVTLDLKPLGATFVGTLNAQGEIVGTYTKGPITADLTFRRAAAAPAGSKK